MKPLENLINVEKARLLHELFPQEIPALLEYVNGMCLTIQEDEQSTRNQWENGLLTVESWLSFVEEIRNKIERYGKRMHKQSRLFADQLFDGYVAIYMVHCMTLYTTIRNHPNHKFSLAIDLLFNP
ncbi:MAG: hypothetical protein BGO69_05645 [Bacteroidetes bacterium 46-16]|nr:MAG: hypothetical protein BGO69_05645 [Bacteroidetes bacterium 46-16]